jgi:DNA-binding transcriptional LysR family regulator
MLDLRRLRLLSELARRGTIAEVARVVGYTPSAISQSLLQLEREAGVPLLERDGRRVRLTPAARGLVARTDRVLAELDAAEAELAAAHGTVRGTVTIGAFPSAAAGLVAPAVADLRERHPELSCQVVEHEPESGIPVLRSGELDVLVSESYEGVEAVPTGGLEAHPLLSEPLLVVLPRGEAALQRASLAASAGARPHAASAEAISRIAPPDTALGTNADPIPLQSLADAPWIAGLAGTQFAAALEQACREAGFAPRIVHRADDARLVESLVEAGLGVALLPALACSRSDAVRFAEATPAPPRREVTALVRSGAARRPSLAAVLDALVRQGSLAAAEREASATASPAAGAPAAVSRDTATASPAAGAPAAVSRDAATASPADVPGAATGSPGSLG